MKKNFRKKLRTWVERYEVMILLLLLVAILRVPSLFEPNWYADEAISLTLGQGLREGLVLYRDIHDNKPPLLYLVAAVAGNVMWFRLILMIWNLVNVVLVWKLAERLIKKRWLVGLATGLFGIFSSIPLTEGNIANGEVFMIMPVTAGVLIVWGEYGRKKFEWGKWMGAGLLFAVGFLFKAPVLFDLLGVLFWLSVYQIGGWRGVYRWIADKRFWAVLIGFVMPILASVGYYMAVGARERYLGAALGQNIDYIFVWGGGGGAFYEIGLFQRSVVVVAWVMVIWLLRKRLGGEFGLVALWLIGALFGANLAGRPYPHYLIGVVAPASILVGLVLIRVNWVRTLVGVGLAATIGLAVWKYEYWYYRSVDYYLNFAQYVTGKKDREEFYAFWGEGVLRNMRVAEYIRQRTNEDDRIFVWGTEPAIYVLSDRLPAGRYTVAYHIHDFGGMEETMEALKREKPKYIVMIEGERFERELDSYVFSHYIEVLEDGGAGVWRRLAVNDLR